MTGTQRLTTFKKEKYYHVRLALSGAEAASERISDKAEAEPLKTTCEASKQSVLPFEEKRPQPRRNSLTFTSLQGKQPPVRIYAKQTLDLAQALYEKRLLT